MLWNTECDLDLHMIEPSGFEIYYGAKTSPNTGKHDIDDTGVDAYSPRIENVSWKTAPSGTYKVMVTNYGACWSDVPYKIYVTVNRVSANFVKQPPQIHEFIAPGGSNEKIHILSFDF